MQYHLDTIPVWEAMEWKSECPLCSLEHKTELEEIDRTLGASVMEPDVRVRFNERGACRRHQQMLFNGPNKLGHALLMDSHAKERLAALQKLQAATKARKNIKVRWFGRDDTTETTAAQLKRLTDRCVVCEAMDTHMARYLTTFLHLWKTSADFRAVWKDSKGVCLPHLQQLLETARGTLSAHEQNEFAFEALDFLTRRLADDERDLSWFTQKYDYRNQAQPWGESKTAVERTVNCLRGWCVGTEPYTAPK